jgi:hypothetical protein
MKNLKKILAIAIAVILLAPAATQTVYAAETNGIYEAEDGTFSDPYYAWATDYSSVGVVDPATKVFTGLYAGNASGGLLGAFNVIGNSVTWTVEADAAGKADLLLSLANNYNIFTYNEDYTVLQSVVHTELELAGHVKLTVNGTEVDLTGVKVPGVGDITIVAPTGLYTRCEKVSIGNVALKAGTNVIKLEVINAGATTLESVSVDYLEVSNYTADPVDDGNDDAGNDAGEGTGTGAGTENEEPTIPNKGDASILLISVLFAGLALVVIGYTTKKKFA